MRHCVVLERQATCQSSLGLELLGAASVLGAMAAEQ